MKHSKILYLLGLLCLLSLSAVAQTTLQEKLKTISLITEIKPLESKEFAEKYVTYFTQPLDHDRPELGSFRQRVIISHIGFDRPTVIVTEGYGAGYALSPRYREELSKMFNWLVGSSISRKWFSLENSTASCSLVCSPLLSVP